LLYVFELLKFHVLTVTLYVCVFIYPSMYPSISTYDIWMWSVSLSLGFDWDTSWCDWVPSRFLWLCVW